jgi:hypothetical protein
MPRCELCWNGRHRECRTPERCPCWCTGERYEREPVPARLFRRLLVLALLLIASSAAALDWYAFEPTDAGGVTVAICGEDAWGALWYVTARATGTPPRVRAWMLDGFGVQLVYDWAPYDEAFGGGVSVSCAIVRGIAQVITGAGITGGPHVRVFGLFPPGVAP